jgi:hypothetical protein
LLKDKSKELFQTCQELGMLVLKLQEDQRDLAKSFQKKVKKTKLPVKKIPKAEKSQICLKKVSAPKLNPKISLVTLNSPKSLNRQTSTIDKNDICEIDAGHAVMNHEIHDQEVWRRHCHAPKDSLAAQDREKQTQKELESTVLRAKAKLSSDLTQGTMDYEKKNMPQKSKSQVRASAPNFDQDLCRHTTVEDR